MRVRLGYVAMSLKLKDCSPSKTITVKNLEKISDHEARISRLCRIAGENLRNCQRLLYYNAAHHIRIFRFTSRLVPLATHPLTEGWDYTGDLAGEFARIGEIVREHEMRVSSHPDHFTLINSPRPEVLEASLRDLAYHETVFKAMGLMDAEMIIHVGGLYGSRETSIQRFKENFPLLPEDTRCRLRLENDDKSFGAAEVLDICRELGIPMVLDVHHHLCHNNGEDISDLLPEVFATWQERRPKVHFSSPKSISNCRAHADDIDVTAFCEFLRKARKLDRDFDVMIEAKNKDLALFNLMDRLQGAGDVTIAGEAAITV